MVWIGEDQSSGWQQRITHRPKKLDEDGSRAVLMIARPEGVFTYTSVSVRETVVSVCLCECVYPSVVCDHLMFSCRSENENRREREGGGGGKSISWLKVEWLMPRSMIDWLTGSLILHPPSWLTDCPKEWLTEGSFWFFRHDKKRNPDDVTIMTVVMLAFLTPIQKLSFKVGSFIRHDFILWMMSPPDPVAVTLWLWRWEARWGDEIQFFSRVTCSHSQQKITNVRKVWSRVISRTRLTSPCADDIF